VFTLADLAVVFKHFGSTGRASLNHQEGATSSPGLSKPFAGLRLHSSPAKGSITTTCPCHSPDSFPTPRPIARQSTRALPPRRRAGGRSLAVHCDVRGARLSRLECAVVAGAASGARALCESHIRRCGFADELWQEPTKSVDVYAGTGWR
jgi:hypothetical protein